MIIALNNKSNLNKNEFLKLDISIVDKESQNKIIANLDIVNTIIELKKEQLKEYAKILYAEARIIEGLTIDNPTEISNLICEYLSK
mgnify:CR=1 FL=1